MEIVVARNGGLCKPISVVLQMCSWSEKGSSLSELMTSRV